jgi:hypothetical protein
MQLGSDAVHIYDPLHRDAASERSIRNGGSRGTIGDWLSIDGAVSDRLRERSHGSRQVINLEPLKKLEDGFVVVEIVIHWIIH